MHKDHSRFSWFGVALIILGAVLLAKKFFILSVGFAEVFWALVALLGFVGVVRGFSRNRRWKVFWNSVWFLYGLFFFLRAIDLVDSTVNIFFPATFMIFGFAFLMAYLLDLRDWYLLIPAVTLSVCGGAFIASEWGYFDSWEVWHVIRTYWPVLLILFGAALMARRVRRHNPDGALPSN